MKFKVKKSVLLENVQTTSSIVPIRHTIFLLSYILIDADAASGKITLSGTDLEMSIMTSFQCDIKESGSITVPGKRFNEVVRDMPDAEIEIESDGSDLKIKCEKTRFVLKGQPKDDFPTLPKVKKDMVITLDQNVFKDLIRKIIFAAPVDDSRQCLNGGYLHIVNKVVKMVATDGHRLAMASTEISAKVKEETGVIIPVKTLNELLRITRGEGDVVIAYSGNQMSFEMGSILFTCRLIEEKYPNYNQVIPQKQDHLAVVDRAELHAANRRVGLVVADRGSSIKYNLSSGKVSLYSISPDVGEGTAEVAIEYEGDDIQIGMNAKYMEDVLRNIESESIELHFSNKLSPVVIRPVGREDYLCLIMPMRQ